MRVTVNDEPAAFDEGATVRTLVAQHFAGVAWLAVAIGGEVVPRSRWSDRPLRDGETVEVLTAVQGG